MSVSLCLSIAAPQTNSPHFESSSLSFSDHAAKLHELPDEYLADALPIAKKIVNALGAENYNILQVRSLSGLFMTTRRTHTSIAIAYPPRTHPPD